MEAIPQPQIIVEEPAIILWDGSYWRRFDLSTELTTTEDNQQEI